MLGIERLMKKKRSSGSKLQNLYTHMLSHSDGYLYFDSHVTYDDSYVSSVL
jgi:hypothetical protein